MRAYYFAYGSNLDLERMRARIPEVRVIGPALLPGMRLTFDKRGGDGSAKANLSEDAASHVWGVVYALDWSQLTMLDAFEPDYERARVSVERNGARLAAETYISTLRASGLEARAWYKQLVVDGARAQGLP
ncbi:MAG TPA: gamma-glutamylcyclotransferase family protein, partial [Myxococcota bacterium]